MIEVTIRVYGPLNDFLPPARRQIAWTYAVTARSSVKDVIEAAGVPHPEVDLVIVNGHSVGFDYGVRDADRIAAFPRFASIDVGAETRVRPEPVAALRFVADVHLGRLARHLRLLGLDTVYRPSAGDEELAGLAAGGARVLLTRDQGLLKRRVVMHGYWVRETDPRGQLVEVLRRFGPVDIRPFSRCLRCNGELHPVPKAAVDRSLPPRTRAHYDEFQACSGCGRVYWKGSHWARLARAVDAICTKVQE